MSAYKLLGELGRGGMGVVYRALHANLDREVAIKFIREDQIEDAHDYVARFEREVDLVKRLSHPSIVKVLDGGIQEGRPFLVMELLEARTLKDRLKGGPLPAREAARMLDQLLDALDYIHGQGMVHRDIKPGNIMLDGPERVVLMDFGLAREEGGVVLSSSREVAGTPRFLAPELLMFQPATPSTDLWAIGCVAYLMLTAKHAFGGATTQALLGQIVAANPESIVQHNPNVSTDVEAFVMKLLAKEPSERWESAKVARDALSEIADAIDVEALSKQQPDETPEPGRGQSTGARLKRSGAVRASSSGSASVSAPAARLTGAWRAGAIAGGAALAGVVLLAAAWRGTRVVTGPSVVSTPSAAVRAEEPLTAAKGFVAAARLIHARAVDAAWVAVRDAARREEPSLDLVEVRAVVARKPEVAAEFEKLVDELMRGEVGRAWGAARAHVGALLAAQATPAEVRDALLEAVARADVVDALAGHLGRPLPFGVQDAIAPAVELRIGLDLPEETLARSTTLFPVGNQRAAFVFLPTEVPTALGSEFLNLTDTHMYKRVEARERVPAGEVAFRVPGGAAGRVHLRIGVLSTQTYVKLARPGGAGWLPVRLPDGARVAWEHEKWLTVTLWGAMAAAGEWRASQARAWTVDPQRPYYALDRVLWEPIP